MKRKKIIRKTQCIVKHPFHERDRLFLNDTYELGFIRGNLNIPQNILACAKGEEKIRLIRPFSVVPESFFIEIYEFNFEYYLFRCLESCVPIIYMTPACHTKEWREIVYLTECFYQYGEKMRFPKGELLYIEFCRRHGITWQKLHNLTGYCEGDIWHMVKDISAQVDEAQEASEALL